MANDDPYISKAELARLRDAVQRAARPHRSIPRREVLDLQAVAPRDAGITVDFAATEHLGMPLLVVRVPIGPRPSPELLRLTPREFEIAGLIAAGDANKEIAHRLGIRTSTVKEHVHRILEKSGLPNRAAVARAYVGGGAGASASHRTEG